MSIAGRGDAIMGFTFFAALGMLLGGIALNRHASVAENPAQTITLGALINNPSFSVHAVDNATANPVVAVDAASHFSRPGPRIIDGLEVLANILHPDLVPENPEYAGMWIPVEL